MGGVWSRWSTRPRLCCLSCRSLFSTERISRAIFGGYGSPKPGGGERGLGIPNVVDRWVQQAVLQVLEPIFEPRFHHSSHGFRANRGAHTAIAEAKQYLAEGDRVVVDLDLSKFFDRVPHHT